MTGFSNPGAWFAVCGLCLALAAGIARTSGFYRERLLLPAGRFESIDGLRGFLALGVFGEHALSMHSLHATGTWGADVPQFYLRASSAGVALFFMITAFLFWLRVLRPGDGFDARAFFASRIRRLTPMYAVSVLMALVVAASASGFALHEEPVQLARELRPWLSFGFMPTGELNGLRDAHAINAVYWTLAYEWAFYLVLPLLALFARGRRVLLPVAALIVFGSRAPVVFNFVFGALAALVVERRLLDGRLGSAWLTPVPLAALAAYFGAAQAPAAVQSALLFIFFIFVVHGFSLLGLLHSGPAKLLGMASYSLYLTHCIVLYVVMRAVDRLAPIAGLSAALYWLFAAGAAAAAVLLSAFTYRHVEFPFLNPRGVPRGFAVPARPQPG